MQVTIRDIFFVAGMASLLTGIAMQFGNGWACIAGGSVLLALAIYPETKRVRRDP
jgi:hypothetical protein